MTNVPGIFGSDVFNESVMRERLPKATYKQLKKTIEDGVPLDMVKRDAILSDTLLMGAGTGACSGLPVHSLVHGVPRRTCAEYNSGFMEDMRRFLKSDEGMVDAAKHRLCRHEKDHAVINYIACQDGFTLQDMVSYNYYNTWTPIDEQMDNSFIYAKKPFIITEWYAKGMDACTPQSKLTNLLQL